MTRAQAQKLAEQPIPETMLQAARQFADPETAHAFFVQMRWPNGVACPRTGCGNADVVYMPKQHRWFCRECKGQFTAKLGTIFEDSPIGFDKWLPAVWLIASARNGISSYEIARALAVTQKTAWFMLHRIREAMQDQTFSMLTGTVEIDEAYIGGKYRNKSLAKRKKLREQREARGLTKAHFEEKTAVLGMVERGGRVRAWSVPEVSHKTLLPKLGASIHHDATVYTDSSGLYTHINEYFLHHSSVNHSIEEYVRGNVHTNNIECFWAVLKRTIGGTYIHVHPRHLDRYLAEQVYRFDERQNDDGPRFAKAVKRADGRRLTWKVLTDKSGR
jgi:transposase-like protein